MLEGGKAAVGGKRKLLYLPSVRAIHFTAEWSTQVRRPCLTKKGTLVCTGAEKVRVIFTPKPISTSAKQVTCTMINYPLVFKCKSQTTGEAKGSWTCNCLSSWIVSTMRGLADQPSGSIWPPSLLGMGTGPSDSGGAAVQQCGNPWVGASPLLNSDL